MRLTTLVLTALTLTPAMFGGPITYFAELSGLNEDPTNASPGTGTAIVTFDDVAHTLRVQVSFSNLLGGTTASHIHCCGVPSTHPLPATMTPSFSGFPNGVLAGTYDQTFDTLLDATYRPGFLTSSGGTAATAEATLAAGLAAGQAYLNIHTSTYSAGEILGILTPVPEPGTFLLAGLALGGVWLRRKRR